MISDRRHVMRALKPLSYNYSLLSEVVSLRSIPGSVWIGSTYLYIQHQINR